MSPVKVAEAIASWISFISGFINQSFCAFQNGNYVLPMRWLETPVKFTCPIPISSAATPLSTPKPAHQTWTLPLPHGLKRQKRHIVQPSSYDPRLAYYNWLYSYYSYWYLMRMQQTPGTTTAMPSSTVSTAPSTARPPQTNPPYPVYYPYYLYYPYYPYYLYPYYPFPNTPVATTPPVTTTTTAPATTEITSTASATTTGSVSSTTMGSVSSSTTTGSALSTTIMPTTPVPTAKTTKPCQHTLKPSTAKYPGQMKPYVPYDNLTFPPYIFYKNKAGNLPGDQNYMHQGGYDSGLNARAHPPPYPGFDYWQPLAWFPNGQDKPQYGKSLKTSMEGEDIFVCICIISVPQLKLFCFPFQGLLLGDSSISNKFVS